MTTLTDRAWHVFYRALSVSEVPTEWAVAEQPLWELILQIAARHGLMPMLHYRLKQKQLLTMLPVGFQEQLRDAYLQSAARSLKNMLPLAHLLKAFHQAGVSFILLKGAHLANGVYPKPGLRSMGDFDLLVRRVEIPVAVQEPIAAGYQFERPYDLQLELQYAVHLPPLVKRGMYPIELHVDLLQQHYGMFMDVEGAWQRRQPFDLEGVLAWGLGVEDLIVHTCIHAVNHGLEFGIRPLVDLAEILNKYAGEIDWQRLSEVCLQSGSTGYVAPMLALARQYLHAPLPADTLQRLGGIAVPEQILTEMRRLMENPSGNAAALTINLSQMLTTPSLWQKVRIGLRRIFIPSDEIRRYYLSPNEYANLPLGYFRRVQYILRTYGGSALFSGGKLDSQAESQVERQQRMDALTVRLREISVTTKR